MWNLVIRDKGQGGLARVRLSTSTHTIYVGVCITYPHPHPHVPYVGHEDYAYCTHDESVAVMNKTTQNKIEASRVSVRYYF